LLRIVLFVLPLMRMAGVIAMVAAVVYWITILVVRLVYKGR
jgi:hypothetical protein